MAGRTLSLQARQLLAASLGLVAFLGLTGYALDQAFVEVAGNTMRQRLQNYAWAYMRGTELLRNGDIIPPENPPDARLSSVGSGLYAAILADDFRWESESALGRELPFDEALKPGEDRYEGPIETSAGTLYRQSMGMAWEVSDIKAVNVTVHVAETTASMDRQVSAFRRALWAYLGAAGALLLALQTLVLRWSLAPLRRVVGEMEKVTAGEGERLSGSYPQELTLLTDSLNALIDVGREQIARNRNILGDLAHSLKTPLAVLRARLESDADGAELRDEVSTQLDRMNDLVSYQLGRAASSGHKLFAAPVEIEPHAEQIVRGLEKIYARKGVICEFELDPAARFHGEPGDLQELLGNLLENAFKWARSRVLLTVKVGDTAANRRPGLRITVEDDGPGIPEERIAMVLQRGVRGDERVHGHGIGLSIVQDIVRSYRGQLEVGRSQEFGGACFSVSLPPGL